MSAQDRALDGVPIDAASALLDEGGSGTNALAIACFAVCILFATFVVAVTYFGTSADGSPSVSVRLNSLTLTDSGPMPSSPYLKPRSVSGNLVADPALIEDSPEGPLPVIAPDGRTAMMAYGMPFDRSSTKPQIAIVIGGLGVSEAATDMALAGLPPQVTLAFAPFGKNPQNGVDKARGLGHEVLLQVPMEPFDFPDSDPGPHALLVAASAEENLRRLDWAMSRFTGYAGLTNLLGARFLGEAGAIEPVLAEASKRGLLFFDTGASARSLAGTAARHANAKIATGTMILDEVQTPKAIDTKLAALEKQARGNTSAIGVASLYPVTVARINEWMVGAANRGFLIVPVSALVTKPDTAVSAATH
jgi:polysaccharide deacetylase 2 family uncharacterized protein YibQ